MNSNLASKVWSFCDVLRDDGVSYGDYLEQFTYLLFLKMADEYSRAPYNYEIGIPEKFSWQSLVERKGAELENHYNALLRELGKQTGMIGKIFVKAQSKIQDPAKLAKLIALLNETDWVMEDADVKGDIYEAILEKNAEDTKSGAGQYFTPRALIKAMIECVQPKPKKTIADPACGTGGFFLGAYDYIVNNYELDKSEKKFLKFDTFSGNEIVASTRRLCLMNLLLHNIGDLKLEKDIVVLNDALITNPGTRFDYVFANPPFGKKCSVTITNEEGHQKKDDLKYNRQDFWVTTSNKQLNFVQHIVNILKVTGQAAVVVPDNVLFEGGAGEIVRRKLLETTDLHTVLRLPTGIFYAQGVKANVIFFDNKPASKEPQTKEVWIYDYRTNVQHTLKTNPLKFEDLSDFIKCYKPENRHKRKQTWSETNTDGRWRKFTYEEIIARDKCSLDISWIRDNSKIDLESLPEPLEIANDIAAVLKEVSQRFNNVVKQLSENAHK
jgi:type I restriction enzyme M protein